MEVGNIGKAARTALLGTALMAAFAQTAEARSSSRRQGFNFGTSVSSIDTTETSNGGEGSSLTTNTQGSGMSVTPYIGYAWTYFDLGLVYSSESVTSNSIETSADGSHTTTRNTSDQGKSLSLFARYMFASVFFFEGGFGGYQDTTTVHSETRQLQSNNAFNGSQDDYQLKGVGLGYHGGIGLELPMSNGFFFTAAYQVRSVQLRDHFDSNTLGHKMSDSQRREALFGVAYYDSSTYN